MQHAWQRHFPVRTAPGQSIAIAAAIIVLTGYGTNGTDTALTSGAGYGTLDGNSSNDVLEGCEASDTLSGGSDQLWGGDGDDILNGGADTDTIKGGAGHDTYVMRNGDGDGSDTVINSDGQGSITWGGATLSVGKKVTDSTWQSTDGSFTFALVAAAGEQDTELIIRKTGGANTSDTLRIPHFQSGHLGLDITVGKAADTPQERTFTATLSDADSDRTRAFRYAGASSLFYTYLGQQMAGGLAASEMVTASNECLWKEMA